ncbi:restriction endonuclease subunit S [Tenacibaculum aestuariivivum]|uniref:restriction endonuclease subunit S n=1 Tax=Tenacibaculum aestuariivivum TaxID=2006131 RepID=UPI003AB23E37
MSQNTKNLIPILRFPKFKGEWRREYIKNLAKVVGGGTPSTTDDEYWNGEINWFTPTEIKFNFVSKSKRKITDLGLNKSSATLLPKGTILLTTRATIGEVAIAQEECTTNQGFQSLIVNKSNSNKFIFYLIKVYKNELYKRSNGSTFKEISKKEIEKIKVSIPTLPEQEKIASFLTDVDAKITQLTKKKTLLEAYKKGIMQKIFNQQLRFKDNNQNDFPNWEVKKLGDVANYRRGSFPQPYGLPKWYDKENGVPFIQVYDVDNNMLLKSTTKNKISTLGAEQSVFVKKGTLIITIQGSIGRIAKTQYDAYVDRTLLIFQSYKKPLNIDYFKYVLFLLFEIEKKKAPGGIIKTITKEVLSSFKIQIPCIEEQTKIANFLSEIDIKIEALHTKIENAKKFKKGLLQQLFV